MQVVSWILRLLLVTWVVVSCVAKMAAVNRKYPLEVHQMFQQRLNGGRKATSGLGSWTPWSQWTPCSRSCGGGVAAQTRDCQHLLTGRRRRRVASAAVEKATLENSTLENSTLTDTLTTPYSKSQCVGVYKRFHVCNDEACPLASKDFRQSQCEAFNRKQFMGRIYFWEPFLDAPNNCELNCRPVGFRFYATLNKTVIDGTPCQGGDKSRRWVCVTGACKHVGCDGVVGSSRAEDACGVCGGDNSTCRLVSGLFTRPQLPVGYNLVAQLPRGACNLSVAELKHSRNYLALRRHDGTYVINGNWAINWSGDYDAVGTRFSYKRQDANAGESIVAPGPLSDPVDLMLIYQQPNTGIKYEYMLPMKHDVHGVHPEMSPPAINTARHPQIAPPLLLPPSGFPLDDIMGKDRSGLDPVETKSPDNVLYPYGVLGTDTQGQGRAAGHQGIPEDPHHKAVPRTRAKKRKFAWKTEYTKCSKTCGGGVQTSVPVCVREHNSQPVSVKRCNLHEKPVSQTVRCNVKPCPAEWVGGEWGECSVTCGTGVQTRDIMCKQEISSTLTMKVVEGACLAPLTLAKSQPCQKPSCLDSDDKWHVGSWGQCSAACGEGTRTRPVLCDSTDPEDCPLSERPDSEEPCDTPRPCSDKAQWLFTEWTPHCSEECGTGVQTRRVMCSGSSCDGAKRPEESRACSSDKQCSGKWFAGPWGHCSARCGPGKETRNVVCVSFFRGQHRVAPDVNCGSAPKPAVERSCELNSCSHEWFSTEWTECSRDCGNGMQWREVKCLTEKGQMSEECSEAHEPAGRRTCNTHHCPESSHKLPSESVTHHHKNHFDRNHHKSHTESQSHGDPVVISADQARPGQHDEDISNGSECKDSFRNCHLVVQSRLCKYKYYHNACCLSCLKKP